MRRKPLLTIACCSCVIAVCAPAAADTDTQLHLGLESSIYSKSSIDGSATPADSSTENKVEQTVSEVGLPGSTRFSLGALFNDQFDIGMGFGYSSQKTDSGSSKGSLEISGFEFDPYFAFVTGSHRDSARAAFGIMGGIGNAKVTITTVSSSSLTGLTTTTTSESSADSKSFGAFLKFYGFVGNSASIDPGISVMSTHASASGVDLSGLSYLLSVGFSIWPGRSVQPAEVRPKPSRAAENSIGSRSADHGSAAAPRVITKPKPGIVTLRFGKERAITFVRDAKSAEPTAIVLVRDPAQEDTLSSCAQLTFHAVNQEDETVEAAWGTASSQAMRFQVLKASVSVETLKKMVAAPIASNASTPEHWIDVCAQRWKISEGERAKLKEFVVSLRSASSKPETAPADPESAPVSQ